MMKSAASLFRRSAATRNTTLSIARVGLASGTHKSSESGRSVQDRPVLEASASGLIVASVGMGLAAVLFATKGEKKRPEGLNDGKQGLCILGEGLMDFLPNTAVDGDKAYSWRAGGAPFNVCIAASRMGVTTSFFTALSKDFFGQELYQLLGKENVDLSLAKQLDLPTILAFVSQSKGDVNYAFFKENASLLALTSADAKAAFRKAFSAVHLSCGAITLEDDSFAKVSEESMRLARSKGAFTSFDSNLRPPMIKKGVDNYRAKVEKLTKIVDFSKSSDADIEFLYGKEANLDSVAARWLELGSHLVVITCGSKGATAYFKFKGPKGEGVTSVTEGPPGTRPNTVDANGRSVPVEDTVGCGDTCMGTMLAGILGGDGGSPLCAQVKGEAEWDDVAIKRLRTVLRQSVAAAAVNCSRKGCDPPTKTEVVNLANKM